MISAKHGFSEPIKWIQSTGEVRQRTSSHLATIISCALLLQDDRIPCPVDRNLEIFLTSHIDFLFIFGQCGDNCTKNLFLKRKEGVTERPRLLNPSKATTMAICPIIVQFSASVSARSMHGVACEFACVLGCAEIISANVLKAACNAFDSLSFCILDVIALISWALQMKTSQHHTSQRLDKFLVHKLNNLCISVTQIKGSSYHSPAY